MFDNIDIILSHLEMNSMDMNIAVYQKANWERSLVGSADIYKFQVVSNILERVKDKYDFIFIDCPPSLNYVSLNAIYASNYYLIPTLLDRQPPSSRRNYVISVTRTRGRLLRIGNKW